MTGQAYCVVLARDVFEGELRECVAWRGDQGATSSPSLVPFSRIR